jgi:hypothetical protein
MDIAIATTATIRNQLPMAISRLFSLVVYRTPAEPRHRPEAQATDTSGHVDNPADGVKFRRGSPAKSVRNKGENDGGCRGTDLAPELE